jgi:Tol biopolymer transport system component
MTLAAGTKHGPYDIVGPLGVGGMGEVYRARDTRLNRDVALKVLPELFAGDPERLARFQREAQVLASLNHPNIAHIHGLEDSGGIRALVMELVEGPTLADRIAGTAISVPEALPIARQIIDALEAAHEQGVVHRDLKPANIKVRDDGTVKVLDFGLAKMLDPVRADGSGQRADAAGLTASPTITTPAMTEAGMILGTASYMAPEQARGKTVDKRADVWAFGVVLYEMLTGKRLFSGEETSDVLAGVLKTEPDWTALPANTPSGLRRLLPWCLEKDPKRRLRDIGDARVLLDDTAAPVAHGDAPSKPWAAGWVAAALCLLAAAGLALVHFREERPAPERVVRFNVPPPEKSTVTNFSLSPDGRYLALVADEGGRTRLWVRPLESLNAQPLPGTDDAQGTPFWSPDSASIAFFAQGKLKKISVSGGPPQILSDGPGVTGGGTWSRDGVIVFGGAAGVPLKRVAAAGGAPVALDRPGPGETDRNPHFLPDGRRFLYTNTGSKSEISGIYVGSLDGTPPARLLPDLSMATYAQSDAPGRSGYLLFLRENTLMAQAFDPDRLQLSDDIFPVAQLVGNMAASDSGALAYQAGVTGMRQLIWADRTGKRMASVGPAGVYDRFRLAPDETRIVFDRVESSNTDIWTLDLLRGTTSRLTLDPATDNLPIWSSDGLRVLFPSSRNGGFDLYIKAATGVGREELWINMETANGWGTDWSRDGRFILYQRPGANTKQDLWIAPQSGDRKPFPYLQEPYSEQNGMFSPDGHWVAYMSDESGRNEVYVQAFPLSGEKRQISTGGGSDVSWRGDGAELFYLAADRNLMAVPVKVGRGPAGPTFEPGVPKALFPVPGNRVNRSYGAASDGRRFLLSTAAADDTAIPVTVVLNWAAILKKQ